MITSICSATDNNSVSAFLLFLMNFSAPLTPSASSKGVFVGMDPNTSLMAPATLPLSPCNAETKAVVRDRASFVTDSLTLPADRVMPTATPAPMSSPVRANNLDGDLFSAAASAAAFACAITRSTAACTRGLDVVIPLAKPEPIDLPVNCPLLNAVGRSAVVPDLMMDASSGSRVRPS